ncbi:hypothetical protein [Mesorhizobium sp.]|uniref:hypothetical protein n=1 Tax=Mesorhizobium sp. TaxID=1871066 RepID=UPI000FE974FB|nr:hypothetical protein [Mesorhizobium sp.]RWP37429.1 MAG: hypothetical protein EOR03_04990 [Mesorhizobium sp.]
MTILTNGNFDRVIEFDIALLTAVASATLKTKVNPARFNDPNFEADVATNVHFREIWFKTRPPVWANTSGFGPASRDFPNWVTLALELEVKINVRRLLTTVVGMPVVVDLDALPVDEPLRTARKIAFTAYVEVTDRIEKLDLNARFNREDAFTPNVPCVVIDFAQGAGGGTFVETRLREYDLRQALPIKLLMAAAEVRQFLQGNGPGGGEAEFNSLVAKLKAELSGRVAEQLAKLIDWQTDSPGKAILYLERTDPLLGPILQMAPETRERSLVIGLDYLAKVGNPPALATTLKVGETLSINVSNRQLLRVLVRSNLAPMIGLNDGDFNPAEYCQLAGPAQNLKFNTKDGTSYTGNINSLVAVVDGASHVLITMEIQIDVMPGVILEADLVFVLAFSVVREVQEANQVLKITQTLLNQDSVLASHTVHIAWWVYVLTGLTGGQIGLIALAALDAIFADIIAGNLLRKGLGNFQFDPNTPEVNAPVTLINPTVSLNDPGAPPMPTPFGPLWYNFLGAAAHDLHIGADFEPLPDPLVVSCQVPDVPGKRMKGIGGTLADGRPWRLTLDSAVSLVEAGRNLQVQGQGGATVPAVVGKTAAGLPYLHIENEDRGMGNLSNLPTCS